MRLTARVPATAANLGPGFDCFGLALDLCNEFTVDTDSEPGITWEGEGADELPTDGSDMVTRAMRFAERRIADAHGPGVFPLPAFALHGRNRIPFERGLGSSAAAAVAGVCLAYRILDLDVLGEQLDVGVVGDADDAARRHRDHAQPDLLQGEGGLGRGVRAGAPGRNDPPVCQQRDCEDAAA